MREATSAQVLDIHNALDSWRDTPEWKAIDEKGVRRFVWDDDDPLRDSLLLQYGAYPAENSGIPYPVILSQASTVIDCRVENGADPRASVRITRGAGSGQHLASILQEGRENANIDAGLGFIWRISVERETPVKRSDQDANNRFALHRRGMLLATAAAFFPIHGASGETGSRNAQPDVGSNAAPAVPIPAIPSLGTGKDRALVLGGGGEYFIAWLLGFAHGLHSTGVSYDLADVIVGTSAGAIVGTAVAADHAGLLRDDLDFFGRFPKLLADLI